MSVLSAYAEGISIIALAAFVLVFRDNRKHMSLKALFLLITLAAVVLGGVAFIIQDFIHHKNLLNPTT